MPDPRYKSISIDIETHEKLIKQAERNYRTVPAHIRYLVDFEDERQEMQLEAIANAEAAFAILEDAE